MSCMACQAPERLCRIGIGETDGCQFLCSASIECRVALGDWDCLPWYKRLFYWLVPR
jgi:hypothetical protein